MNQREKYVVFSLELHLFFARIMKEHALFLKAGFTPPATNFADEAETYKMRLQELLCQAVTLSNGIIRPNILRSGEIVTEFTARAEQETQRFTGITIDSRITAMELELHGYKNACISSELAQQVQQLNAMALKLLNGLIKFKERVLSEVLSCNIFTLNFPLLIQHILREAKLYRTYVMQLENKKDLDCRTMQQNEKFWNRIMLEHALFIRALLDPCESKLIAVSDAFAQDYSLLLEKSKQMNEMALPKVTEETLRKTVEYSKFKQSGTKGIQECKIKSIILPLLADHVLREANHYVRLLAEADCHA